MEKIIFVLVLAIVSSIPAFADDYIYDSPYGGKTAWSMIVHMVEAK